MKLLFLQLLLLLSIVAVQSIGKEQSFEGHINFACCKGKSDGFFPPKKESDDSSKSKDSESQVKRKERDTQQHLHQEDNVEFEEIDTSQVKRPQQQHIGFEEIDCGGKGAKDRDCATKQQPSQQKTSQVDSQMKQSNRGHQQESTDPNGYESTEDCNGKGTKGGNCNVKKQPSQVDSQMKQSNHGHQQESQQGSLDQYESNEDCNGKGTKAGNCNVKKQPSQQKTSQVDSQMKQSNHGHQQESQQTSFDPNEYEPTEDCDGKGTKGGKGGKSRDCAIKKDITKRFKRSDDPKPLKVKPGCQAPEYVKLVLKDHFGVFPDTVLQKQDLLNQSYSHLEWHDSRFFSIDPYIEVEIKCPQQEAVIEKTLNPADNYYEDMVVIDSL